MIINHFLQPLFVVLIWITAILVFAALVLLTLSLIFKVRYNRHNDYGLSLDEFGTFWGFLWTGVAAVVAGIILVLSFIPYQSEYWQVYDISGTVTSTSYHGGPILDGDTGTVYILKLDGKSQPYVVGDDRATQYKVGQTIKLACTEQWNYGYSKKQFNCNLGNF